MDRDKTQALEAGGWRVGTVQEFLGLTDEENTIVELRVALALQIRRLRAELGLTQAEFAKMIKSSQSRVAKLEAGAATVSLDLMFHSYVAAGGKLNLSALFGAIHSPRVRRPASKGIPAKAKAKKAAAASGR
jgi:DNA-binding XRE family transcriptional regulator